LNNIELLITGIRGFIGSNFKDYVKSDPKFKITGTSRDESKIDHLRGEIKNTSTISDVIEQGLSFHSYIHLSGKVYDFRDKKNEDDYFAANYGVTKQLMDYFAKDPKAKNFIFLSTIHVLTENPEEVLDESYVPKPFTPYGKSKFKAEQYIREYCPKGKNYYILRPSMIHGPGNKGNLNLLYNLVKSGIPYPVGAHNNSRSFVSIENLCFILREIITRQIKPGLYHIADDEPTKTHELVRMIAEATGKKGRLWNIHPKLLELIAKLGNRIPIFINEHRLNKLTGDFIVSNEKIKRAIGKPLPVSSSEGLKLTLSSLKDTKIE
jgi:nucleoside-diphosphate-sugar epimerase